MISIKDVTILDILPHAFKTDEYRALSKAIAALTGLFYEKMSSVLFWADIENASPELLDAMAAELDAPFYSSDMQEEQKRSVIAAAFAYNSRIGTVSSIKGLLAAVFGGGNISEWYEYGGEPYYFRLQIDTGDVFVDYDKLLHIIERVRYYKNLRSKLESIGTNTEKNTKTVYVGLALHGGSDLTLTTEAIDYENYTRLVDENEVYLSDENGDVLHL